MAVQKSLGGAAGKNLPGAKSRTQLLFLDDLNCASADAFGIQPPLELLRQILSQGTLMLNAKFIVNVQMSNIEKDCSVASIDLARIRT